MEKLTKEAEMQLLSEIDTLVRQAGRVIRDARPGGDAIHKKQGDANFVTDYDVQIQRELIAVLHKILPEASFFGEEYTEGNSHDTSGWCFYIDPIDGTTNFIKDYNMSVVSVGLTLDGEKYMGVVYKPYSDEMFTAVKGQGAFLNDRPIHVSAQPLSNGLVLFGTAPYYEELSRRSFEMAYDYFKKALDVRRSGSAAFDLCSVAAGRAELFFELSLSHWDYAAGALILEEAGGKVTTIEGGPLTLQAGCSVLATNGIA